MKITYEEFNDLQRQQKIRDYAQEIFNTLICLGYIAENKHSKQQQFLYRYFYNLDNEIINEIIETIRANMLIHLSFK